jgi:hypothetical protein
MNWQKPLASRLEVAIAVGITAIAVLGALALGRGHYQAAVGVLFAMTIGFARMGRQRERDREMLTTQAALFRRWDNWLIAGAFVLAALALLLAPSL